MFEIIRHNNRITYYLDNKRHRKDGPDTIWNDGSISYYLNNLPYKKNGPAYIWGDGYVAHDTITNKTL